MRLRSLYANSAEFGPITFRDGLNVVIGSVQRPRDSQRDTHNLGKSLLALVIDFCLLRGKKADFFLFRHQQFADFAFFLELEIETGSFVTIRRSVSEGTKASFMLHANPGENFVLADQEEWTHWMVPFAKAKELLDGILNLRSLGGWSFRSAVAYSLRTQRDYDEPFKLAKFAGGHADWKPFLAHMLGLDSTVVSRGYEIEARIAEKELDEARLRGEAGSAQSQDQVQGLIQIAEREVGALESEVDRFDLAPADRRVTTSLVADIDQAIASLNEERYEVESERARIVSSLDERLSLDVEALGRLFAEAQLYFSDQVVRDYSALERFNRELLEERDRYLREDMQELEARLTALEAQIVGENERRTAALKAISDAQAFAAFKRLSAQLSSRRAELEVLRLRSEAVQQLAEVRRVIRGLKQDRAEVRELLENSVERGSATYSLIKQYFDEIVESVIGQHANLYTRVNDAGHLEFHADIVDARGMATSAADGFTYGRLLCIAFDMAVLRAYSESQSIHFVYHDGALETLDDRKKLKLIATIRTFASAGTQHIITVIDSELPVDQHGSRFSFDEDEIILRLHDGDDSGRLFRMPSW